MYIVNFPDPQTIEKEFFELINGDEEQGNFKTPLILIKELRTKYNKCDFEYQFLTIIIRHYKRILLMNPKSIQFWIKHVDRYYHDRFYKNVFDSSTNRNKFEQTDFGKALSNALAYEKLQKKVLKKFFHRNQIKTCNYCNSQYTLTFKQDGIESVKFQLDHIFPKKKYPYFSISMYNLIPSCASCNLNKGDKDFWIKDFCHPFLDSFSDKFKFTLSKESDSMLYTQSSDIDFDDITIGITNKRDKKVNNHNNMFDIEGLYSNFSEIAFEIISLGREYPEVKRYELLEKYKDENQNKLFTSKESIDRIFLRVYPDKKNINERPLSKFIQDIARFTDFYDDKD